MSRTLVLSVVMPTFNRARFLKFTLGSLLAHECESGLELIVIDGGSSDGTVDILQAYDDRLAYWVSEPDQGQSHAINKGLAKATGDIIGYLNSDDTYLPGALEAVARAAQENPDADLFYGRCRTMDEVGGRLPKTFSGDISSVEEVLDLWNVWWGGRNFVQPEVFWTRRIMEKVGPFREDLHYAMDYDYWCRCFLAGASAVRIDADLAAFRLWPGQKSQNADEAADELRAVLRGHLEDRSAPIPARTRRRLLARLAYDTEFLPLVARSRALREGRLRRWARIAALLCERPGLALSQPVVGRARETALARALLGSASGSAAL